MTPSAGDAAKPGSGGDTPGRGSRDDPERGSALLVAMGFGTLTVLVILALVGRVITEQRAVARSMAETRAYWAAMGINTYVLSRTMQMGDCGSNCTSAILPAQQGYVAEIADLQAWQYPDVSAAYQFKVSPVVSQGSVAQEMLIRSTFAPPTPAAPMAVPDALASMASVRPVEFGYCLIASSGTTSCASGVTRTPPGYQMITSVHRPMQ